MLALASTVASGAFHLFTVEQIYSNADGTVQFVVLFNPAVNGEHQWTGQSIIGRGPGPAKVFTFPNDLPSFATGGRRALVATQGFAALGIVTPDYVVPNGFLQIPNGTVDYAGVNQVSYSGLPTDGVHSINFAGESILNLATNFAGASASVVPASPPPPPPPAVVNYEGLWWKSPAESESGWGINFAHQGDVIFVTWFTYDLNGKAWWLTMNADKSANGVYSGKIFQTHGPVFSATPFNPTAVTRRRSEPGR